MRQKILRQRGTHYPQGQRLLGKYLPQNTLHLQERRFLHQYVALECDVHLPLWAQVYHMRGMQLPT